MAAGEDTMFNVVVNEPGGNTPINATIIEDALYQSIQDDNTTDGTNLQLALVNVPEVSDTERANALRVRLLNTQANEVSMEEQVFFLFCKNYKSVNIFYFILNARSLGEKKLLVPASKSLKTNKLKFFECFCSVPYTFAGHVALCS